MIEDVRKRRDSVDKEGVAGDVVHEYVGGIGRGRQ